MPTQLCQDIFDVHRAFIFSQYHYTTYPKASFEHALDNAQSQYSNVQSTDSILFPTMVIDDDLFEVVKYLFASSAWFNRHHGTILRFKVMIIPKAVSSVYDPDINYNYTIGNIDKYLTKRSKKYVCELITDANSTFHNTMEAWMTRLFKSQ